MIKFVGRRLLATIPLLFFVSLVVFSFVHVLPGDPAILFLGEEADADTLARFRTRLGFDHISDGMIRLKGVWLEKR